MVSLISSLSRLCWDYQLEEVAEANRKHERHPSALELLTLLPGKTQSMKWVTSWIREEKSENGEWRLERRGHIPAASGAW